MKTESAPVTGGTQPDPRRWKALAVLGLVQFMLVLDMTVVNVALPQIRTDLGFTEAGLAWVVDSYVIASGGLLLLGGRLADIAGRRRMFLIGVGVFAVASTVCGAAAASGVLVGGRFAQGIGQAFAAPAALGLIAMIFTDPRERMKALGLWGGIGGIAGTLGTVISGLLTDLASWRFIFFINVPVGIVALILVVRLVPESRMTREGSHQLDLPGAVLATGGLIAVVYGFLQAASNDWGSWQVLLPVVGGVVLLGLMLVVEARTKAPLIPLSFFTDRTRLVANFTTLIVAAVFFSYFFIVTLFEQQVLGYSPLQSGLSYLPMGLGMFVGIALSMSFMPRLGVKPVLATALTGLAIGVFLTSFIQFDGSYATNLLPGLAIVGLFSGMCFPATGNASLNNVTTQNAGLASGVQSSVQQIGGALGLATLATLSLREAGALVQEGVAAGVAATTGYSTAFRIGAVLVLVAAAVVVALMENARPRPPVVPVDLADAQQTVG